VNAKKVEIICPACGADTLLKREPVYDGLKKTGEKLSCAACGHVFAGEEEVSCKERKEVRVFTEADRIRKVEVFNESDRGGTCRHCAHYLVNPFTQRCELTFREVQATDTCPKFEKRVEKKTEKKEDGPPAGLP
jgi:hypothetical protein